MKSTPIFIIAFLTLLTGLNAQYKNDNTLFKTVYIEDLCRQLQSNPNYVILDVRSQGEYEDTSSALNLNIGHLKNARHIDIRELPNRWRELMPYKDKPIFVYCSHSQRSRRASKLLTDSGFANITNINGGLTTFNLVKSALDDCASQLYESSNPYRLYSPADLCRQKKEDIFLLDIRTDSIFKGISADEYRNTFGKLKPAVNIPLATLAASMDRIPRNKQIVIIDEYGNESPKAARLLLDNGYKSVGVMFNGIESWSSTGSADLPCKTEWLIRNRNYQLINADEFDALARGKTDVVIVDVRKVEEFQNKSRDSWRNIGNIKNAINIPFENLQTRIDELASAKNKTVVVYAFSSQPEIYKAAKMLSEQGFTRINVLLGGAFNLRWRAANIKGKSQLKDWVINTPADNL